MVDYGQEFEALDFERDQLIDHFQNVDINAVAENMDAIEAPGFEGKARSPEE